MISLLHISTCISTSSICHRAVNPALLRTRQTPQDFLLSKPLHLKSTHPIISVDVPATNPPLARKATPSMQHPPVIENQHPSGNQLLPVLVLLLLEQRIKLARSIIPHLDLINRQLDARAIRRIPAHTQQIARRRIVLEHGKAAVGLNANALVPGRMGVHVDRAQDAVRVPVVLKELVCDLEPVDEQRGAARAAAVRQQVERLQARRVRKVRVVRVRFERDVGVCRVLGREVGGEVVEAAVVGFADESNAAQELFCWLRGVERGLVHVAEAVFALGSC